MEPSMNCQPNDNGTPGVQSPASNSRSSRLRTLARSVAFLLLWAAAIWAVCNLQYAIGPLQASICGPWGCSAPIEALLAYHGVWAVVCSGPAVCLALYAPPDDAQRWARHVLWAGLAASGALVAWGVVDWLLRVEPELRQYCLQHGLFVLVDQSDVPAIGITIAGAACLLAVRWRRFPRESAHS
jgi:hypothetical protein